MQEHTKTLFLSSLAKIFRKQLKLPGRLLQFLPREMRAFVSLLLGVTAILLIAVPVVADSQARIVRLSELEGDVQIDRDVGQGFETAVMNLPITQGTKLRAGYDGFAEIEFEDGSTLRFTPGTIVEISQLVLRDSGAKATTVNVLDGVAYVNYEGTKNDEFLLTFGDQKVPLIKSEHVRLEVGHSKARLSVLGGATVQADGPNGTAQVERKRAVTFAMDSQALPSPPTAVTKMQYDAWDERQFEYHERYAENGKYRNSPYAFGMSDLNYFGYFVNSSVCGLVWRPFFASATWDPFLNGSWAWFPSFGYSWVSSYPWGWMPYHFGSWQMCPGYGWSWQPGGTWAGLDNCPLLPRHPKLIPPPPPHEPGRRTGPAETRLIPIDVLPVTRLVIRNDSAGLGIPRGAIGDLNKISRHVDRNGPVNVVFYAASPGGVHQVYFVGANAGSNAPGRQSSGSANVSGGQHSGSGTTNPAGGGWHPSPGAGGSPPSRSSQSSSGSTPSSGSGSQAGGGSTSRPSAGPPK